MRWNHNDRSPSLNMPHGGILSILDEGVRRVNGSALKYCVAMLGGDGGHISQGEAQRFIGDHFPDPSGIFVAAADFQVARVSCRTVIEELVRDHRVSFEVVDDPAGQFVLGSGSDSPEGQ